MLDFTAAVESGGAAAEKGGWVALKQGGEDIEVTDINKHEFIFLRCRHAMRAPLFPPSAPLLSVLPPRNASPCKPG